MKNQNLSYLLAIISHCQEILSAYIVPNGATAETTLNKLLGILDDSFLVHQQKRIANDIHGIEPMNQDIDFGDRSYKAMQILEEIYNSKKTYMAEVLTPQMIHVIRGILSGKTQADKFPSGGIMNVSADTNTKPYSVETEYVVESAPLKTVRPNFIMKSVDGFDLDKLDPIYTVRYNRGGEDKWNDPLQKVMSTEVANELKYNSDTLKAFYHLKNAQEFVEKCNANRSATPSNFFEQNHAQKPVNISQEPTQQQEADQLLVVAKSLLDQHDNQDQGMSRSFYHNFTAYALKYQLFKDRIVTPKDKYAEKIKAMANDVQALANFLHHDKTVGIDISITILDMADKLWRSITDYAELYGIKDTKEEDLRENMSQSINNTCAPEEVSSYFDFLESYVRQNTPHRDWSTARVYMTHKALIELRDNADASYRAYCSHLESKGGSKDV